MKTKKEILSLLLTSTIILSTTGCRKIIGTYDSDNKDFKYLGDIDRSNTHQYFLIKIQDDLEKIKNYFVREDIFGNLYDIKTDVKISWSSRSLDSNVKYQSNYGKVISLIPLEKIIYSEYDIKSEYTADEVKGAYDYALENEEKVKKLELIK